LKVKSEKNISRHLTLVKILLLSFFKSYFFTSNLQIMYYKTKILAVSLLAVCTWAACKKSDSVNTTNDSDDKENIQLLAQSDQIADDMDNIFDEGLQAAQPQGQAQAKTTGGNQNGLGSGLLGPCTNVTFTSGGGADTLVIDYGTQGCVCNDGKTRKGKLTATATHFNALNVVRTLSTNNYSVNNFAVNGSITRTITHIPNSNTRQANITESLSITNPNSQLVYSRQATLTRLYSWGAAGNTGNNMISWGTVSLTKHNGVTVTRTVNAATPLVYKNSCHEIVSGIATIARPNVTYTIDFGSGTCDGQATVSNGSSSWTINL
jgi:hypothetical protein